jgi:lipoprotein-anchoring transpeptidase ErfK/SrfK
VDRRFIIGGGAILVLLIASVFVFKGKGGEKTGNAASTASARELHRKAQDLVKDNELAEAMNMYQQIVTNYPDSEDIDEVQKELEDLNLKTIFSNKVVEGKTVVHEVGVGDSIGKLAKQYGTTTDLIKKSNNLNSDVIRVGQKIRVWTGKFNIFVDKSQNKLILKDGDTVIKVYDVSTGANNSTPVGKFKIISKLVDPVWFNRGVVVPPESPANVLGTRWMGFDIPGYGIHGTVQPDAIGQQVTAGCVRMRNEEVEELYSIVPLGTEVVIVD